MAGGGTVAAGSGGGGRGHLVSTATNATLPRFLRGGGRSTDIDGPARGAAAAEIDLLEGAHEDAKAAYKKEADEAKEALERLRKEEEEQQNVLKK